MNVIDQMQADVMQAVNGDVHGRPGKYYVVGNATGFATNFIVSMDSWKSVFDTGSSEINFNLMRVLVNRDDLTVEPLEQGRGTVGDTLIFDDFLGTTWHVREVGSSADYSGSYYDVLIADYSGPINGV